MQPYLFPYLGYFQLARAVDKFVFYDDAPYIKSGWINRNRILAAGRPAYFTVPVLEASAHKPICDVRVLADRGRWRRKLFEQLRHAYAKSPFWEAVLPYVEQTIVTESTSIAEIAVNSVKSVFAYLNDGPEWIRSSKSNYANAELKGKERVLDICRREGATTYVNLPGGKVLYEHADFSRAGIHLEFLDPNLQPYVQDTGTFVPALSIIDLLVRAPREDIKTRLAALSVER